MQEEVGEVNEAIDQASPDKMEGEFGDLLFSVINAARLYGVDPESALNRSSEKFRRRFTYLEEQTLRRGRQFKDMSMAEMDAIWEEAKTKGL